MAVHSFQISSYTSTILEDRTGRKDSSQNQIYQVFWQDFGGNLSGFESQNLPPSWRLSQSSYKPWNFGISPEHLTIIEESDYWLPLKSIVGTHSLRLYQESLERAQESYVEISAESCPDFITFGKILPQIDPIQIPQRDKPWQTSTWSRSPF